MYFEMAPNYESYVGLDDNGPRDPIFSQKQTKIHWTLTDTDRRTYEENCKEFQSSVAAHGGAITYPTWEQMSRKWIVNGHHMGTTRMSANPNEGVVDPNLKVHGVGNLYVAGSSVFPSGGISNPTFTIVALSLRLASHVKGR
jgi:choline dehydrogenase-like flavoprotein